MNHSKKVKSLTPKLKKKAALLIIDRSQETNDRQAFNIGVEMLSDATRLEFQLPDRTGGVN